MEALAPACSGTWFRGIFVFLLQIFVHFWVGFWAWLSWYYIAILIYCNIIQLVLFVVPGWIPFFKEGGVTSLAPPAGPTWKAGLPGFQQMDSETSVRAAE